MTGHTSYNPIAQAMALAQDTISAVVSGALPAAFISGPPGVGKNVAVRAALDAANIRDPVKSNPTNYLELLADISEAGRRKVPVWLDEADVIFRSDRMLNVIKVATGQRRDRIYNGRSVDAAIIVTTNVPLAPVDGRWAEKALETHGPALFNRSSPVIIAGSRRDLGDYAVTLAARTRMIRNDSDGDGISRALQSEAVDWFTANMDRLSVVAPRTLAMVADLLSRAYKPNPTLSVALAERSLNAMLIA